MPTFRSGAAGCQPTILIGKDSVYQLPMFTAAVTGSRRGRSSRIPANSAERGAGHSSGGEIVTMRPIIVGPLPRILYDVDSFTTGGG